ncbi:MAG: hypothetical protein NTY96_10535 [Bacteroidetes bacterium]|nr:hypothetical protein [Bacteroidota bacterium]
MYFTKIKKGLFFGLAMTLVLFTLLIFSCKKKIPTFYISQESKDYCVYKGGSYWIYRNDSTGTLENIYAYQDPSSDIVLRGGYQEEIIDVYLRGGFLTDYYMQHQCSPDHTINYTDGDDLVQLEIIEPDSLRFSTFALWSNQAFNIEQPDPCNYTYNVYIYIKSELFTNYSYGGISFNNVLHTNYRSADTTNSNPNAFSNHCYFVKHVGLIRFIENSSFRHSHRSFSLVRWSVKQ